MSNVVYLKGTPSEWKNSNNDQMNEFVEGPPEATASSNQFENLVFGRYRPSYVKALLDLTAAELAAKLEISIHTWRSYESNKRQLTPAMAKRLERLFEDQVALLMNCGKT